MVKTDFKLRTKLILITMLIVLLAIATSTYFNLRHFSGIYRVSFEEKIFAQTSELKHMIEEITDLGLELGELKGLNGECRRLVKNLSKVLYCFIMDSDGKIYYHNKKEEISKVYRDDITRKAIVSKSRLVQHFSLDNKKWAYDFNIPIEGMSKNMIGFIRVGISSEVIDDEIIKLRNRTLVIMVFFLVFSSVIILMLNKFTILEPMHILLEGMNKYGAGDLDFKIKIDSKDEFGNLADSFNRMTDNLKDIMASKEQLDKEIHDRKLVQTKLEEANNDLLRNEKALKSMLSDLKGANEKIKDAQNQLVQSEKLASLGQLSAGIAHEINNPIGFISSNFETLEQYVEGYSEILRAVDSLKNSVMEKDIDKAVQISEDILVLEDKINLSFISSDIDNLIRESKSGIERIKKIVQDLRIFSRKDEGQMEDRNIEEILDGSINIVWNEIKYKSELKKEYGDIGLVRCNAQKLGQVFINLLVNAAQSIEEKGEIIIKTRKDNEFAYIEVKDSGDGISEENINKIFDPFFTTKEVGKGTGLGLSVSYDIIKQHKGDVEVVSEQGKGTSFIIKLPIKK
ncbi:MAG: ATP-binding protein [Candidatus Zapsychrus exili]|nr:ATP-binding protein [Candidatus Zapsychrus exili]